MESLSNYPEECFVLNENNYESCGWEFSYHKVKLLRMSNDIGILKNEEIGQKFAHVTDYYKYHTRRHVKQNVFNDANEYLYQEKLRLKHLRRLEKRYNINI